MGCAVARLLAPSRGQAGLLVDKMRKSKKSTRNLPEIYQKSGMMSDPVFLGVPTTPNINSTATISVLFDLFGCSSKKYRHLHFGFPKATAAGGALLLTHHHRSRISFADIAEAAAAAPAVVAMITELARKVAKVNPTNSRATIFLSGTRATCMGVKRDRCSPPWSSIMH